MVRNTTRAQEGCQSHPRLWLPLPKNEVGTKKTCCCAQQGSVNIGWYCSAPRVPSSARYEGRDRLGIGRGLRDNGRKCRTLLSATCFGELTGMAASTTGCATDGCCSAHTTRASRVRRGTIWAKSRARGTRIHREPPLGQSQTSIPWSCLSASLSQYLLWAARSDGTRKSVASTSSSSLACKWPAQRRTRPPTSHSGCRSGASTRTESR